MQLQNVFLLLLAPYLSLDSVALTFVLKREATFSALLAEKFPQLGAPKADAAPLEYRAQLLWQPFRLLQREVGTVDAGVYRKLTSEYIADGVITVTHHPSGHVRRRRYRASHPDAVNECRFLQDTLNAQALWPNFEGFVFNTRHLLFNHILAVTGETNYKGRAALLLDARPKSTGVIDWFEESWGLADKLTITIDAQTGMMLAFAAFARGECYEQAAVQDLHLTLAPRVTARLPLYHGGSWS
jgi:hypothetical protein